MLDDNMLGMRELYDVQLKATYPMEVAGQQIAIGEPIAIFESVQFGNIDELKQHIDARGGYGNPARVSWDNTKEINFNFSQGIFSKLHLALLGNSELTSGIVQVPKIEDLTTDNNSKIELQFTPIKDLLFIYDKNGNKITNYEIEDKTITFIDFDNEDIKVIYEFEYNNAQTIVVGRRLIEGYMELSGKTRLKDDRIGGTITGIIKIPRLKIMSDFSIRLGKDAPPVTANFRATGYPVGPKGREKVLDFILLNNDIDNDI